MASLIVVVDPDEARRCRFLDAVRPHVAPVAGLSTGERACGSFHAIWACGDHVPVDVHEGDDQIAIVWGRPLPKDGSTPIQARDVALTWADVSTALPDAWDGYFAAAAFHPSKGLTVGVDVVGTFPMFWWSSGAVTLCGTSPDLFRRHPLFSIRLDRLGLTGILLTMHSMTGRTLLEGVHRLGQGNLLHALSGCPASEVVQYRFPLSTRYFDMPLEEHLSLYEDAFNHAVRRHIPADTPHGLLLSGGMDSRMVAGFLARQGVPVTALTFGHKGDVEMYCARAVAQALHFEHRTAEADMNDGVACLELHVRLLHASSGLNSIEYWGVRDALAAMPQRITAGYLLDAVVAAYIGSRPYSKSTRTMSFDHFAPFVWAWGVPPDRLRSLLAYEDADDLVDQVLAEMRATYEGYHELESRRYWAFSLNHRQRFHVGQLPWIYSFGSWPAIPACDQTLLEVSAGMATVSLDERFAQSELICRRFPDLARLPLDRNSGNFTPLIPNWKGLLRQAAERRLRPLLRRLSGRDEDRSYYHRVYDFNNAGWRQARRHAEPFRSAWDGIFDRAALDEFLPDPEQYVATRDIFAESSGRKTLLGLLLWARDYL